MTKPSLRMLLTIPDAHCELYQEIEKVPTRHRAERMRTLAAIGLATLRGGVAPSQGEPVGGAVATSSDKTPVPTAADSRKRSSTRQLAGSM